MSTPGRDTAGAPATAAETPAPPILPPNRPLIRVLPAVSDRFVRVEEDLGPWQLADLGTGESLTVTVPAGYESDGASIPRWAWTLTGLYPCHPSVLGAALLHDFLYTDRGPVFCRRRTADRWFRQATIADGLARWRAGVIWAAVRVGGAAAWARRWRDRAG